MELKLLPIALAFFCAAPVMACSACNAAEQTEGVPYLTQQTETDEGPENDDEETETPATETEEPDDETPTEETDDGTQTEEEKETSEPAADEPEQQTAETECAKYVECTYTGLNIRAGAGTSYTSLGKAEKGTLFAYLGTENGWYKTYYKGEAAYLSSYSEYTRLVEMEKGEETVENVIEEGLKLIGTKYVYGATRLHDGNGNLLSGFTATKFDCSSLIQYIFYYGAGVCLQVNTRTQVYQGEYVKPSDLRRGDCIYFTNSARRNNTGIERVGHVALYLGNNYILHTASDYCKIEALTEERWNYYIEARRFA